MTIAIQTASIIFAVLLGSGEAKLIVRPEVREFWPDNIENCGRPVTALRRCPHITTLPSYTEAVRDALSEEATADWAEEWDGGQAGGEGGVGDGGWRDHCGGGNRIEEFRRWLADRSEQRIAVVSHWGAINNILNREPWALCVPEHQKEFRDVNEDEDWACGYAEVWAEGGLSQMFGMPNCGWVAVELSRPPSGNSQRK
jgi:broad specificity phosphatase PhoE